VPLRQTVFARFLTPALPVSREEKKEL
jgi:hypothetical protein